MGTAGNVMSNKAKNGMCVVAKVYGGVKIAGPLEAPKTRSLVSKHKKKRRIKSSRDMNRDKPCVYHMGRGRARFLGFFMNRGTTC